MQCTPIRLLLLSKLAKMLWRAVLLMREQPVRYTQHHCTRQTPAVIRIAHSAQGTPIRQMLPLPAVLGMLIACTTL